MAAVLWWIQSFHLLLLMILLCPLARSQAPEDRSDCRSDPNRVPQYIFPEEWVLMLDSYDYFNLFDISDTISPPVWTARSFIDGSSSFSVSDHPM